MGMVRGHCEPFAPRRDVHLPPNLPGDAELHGVLIPPGLTEQLDQRRSAGLENQIGRPMAGGLAGFRGGGVMIGRTPSSKRRSRSRSVGSMAAASVMRVLTTRRLRLRLRLFGLITRRLFSSPSQGVRSRLR
jgi:hypothetical protein